MSAVQKEISQMLANHPDSADAVMSQLKDEVLAEFVPDESFRELIIEVQSLLKHSSADTIEKTWMSRFLTEFIAFIEESNRGPEVIKLIMADDFFMDKFRENEEFKELILNDIPTEQDLDTDKLIGEVMRRYHAHDPDIRHFINGIQLNDPLVMQRRQ